MSRSLLLAAAVLSACSRETPPPEASREASVAPASHVAPPPSASSTPSASPAVASSPPAPTAPPSAESAPAVVASSGVAPAGAALVAPELLDAAGKPLPQTEDKPRTDSPFFQAAARRLFEAIVADDADLALPFFFPVVAYEQVKDVKNPARDWEYRLIASFRRQLHEYHRGLGRHRDKATFVRLEVPEARAEWMKPGREGNRIGYYRVLRSKLVYADHEGKERSLEVTSLISWRGEWYLVHLHGFE